MKPAALSPTTKEFLDRHIEVVEDLELLLLLRSHPEKEWDAVESANHIGLEPLATSARLLHLNRQGLVHHPEKAGRLARFSLGKLPQALELGLSELALAFSKSRMEVVNHIVTRQRKQFGSFADAFRLRDPKDG